MFDLFRKRAVELEAGVVVELGTPETGSVLMLARVRETGRRALTLECGEGAPNSGYLSSGRDLTVYFTREGCLGSFSTRIMEVAASGDHLLVLVLPPEKDAVHWQEMAPEEAPAREYPRLEITLPVRVSTQLGEFGARSKDLGGSGMAILSPQELAKDADVDLHWILEERELDAKAKVIRCRKARTRAGEGGSTGKRELTLELSEYPFEIALNFVEISAAARDLMVRHVYTHREEKKGKR